MSFQLMKRSVLYILRDPASQAPIVLFEMGWAIPIGTNCDQPLPDLFLHAYEVNVLKDYSITNENISL
jgi:hypothetical protein